MKERRHAPPGKQQESARPGPASFDFGSNADALQMLATGKGEEESSLLLDESTDEKQLLEAKPGAPVRDTRPPAAPPAAPPAPGAPKAGPQTAAPEAAVEVEAAEEEVEEEVVAEAVEKEAPVEEPADKPGDGGAPEAPPAAPPADGPSAPPAAPAAPPAAPEAPPSSGPTEVARAPSAPAAPAAPSGGGAPPPAAPPAPPAAPSRRAAAPGPASAPPGAKASPAPAATEGPGQAVTWFAGTPASEQPAARAGLGDAIEAAAHESHHAASADLPTLSAEQTGPDAVLAVPKLAGPDAASDVTIDKSAAPIDAGTVPEASAPRPINATKSDDPALAMKALDAAAPKIPAAPAPPPVVLQGEADPGQLGTLSSDASTEVAVAQAEASASLAALTPDLMATKPVHETIALPAVPAPEALPELAPVGEMERLEQWDLAAQDQDAFDAHHGNLGEDALNGIADEMKTAGTDLQAERVRLVDTGLADADAANAEAQGKQTAEVEGARSELESETEATRAAQQQAMDDANATIDAQRESAMSEIDARVSTDQAAVDATFRDAQQKADAEVAAGEAKADQAKKPAESQSFWDRAIDAWQSVVQAIADTIVSLWTAVIAKVQAVFDAALSLAQTILDGLVKAVSMLISAYYDLVRSVIRNVLGQVFPELAEALCAWADKVQAALISVCEAIAGALMVALKALADGIIAGMGIALAGYKAYIAFLQSMADSIQRGEWPDAATMLLDALLTAAGIDPAGFRATFGKIDEIIDDVVENPGAIAMNGAEAVGTGFLQFGDNFLEHFVEGSVEWLTGAANVELPDEFSIAGIFDVCCQVLGLTPEYLREKAVEHVGEGGVEAVEEMYAGVLAFLDGGFAGLWEHVQDKLTGLVDDVVIAIGSWLVEKAILVVGRWIAGLAATFGASAILEALIAAWQFAMWIADQMQAMYAIVQSTVDSVYDFVKGNIQPAADKIEGTLANLIAPAIDLVAKLLNISNIADKVQSVIEGVREMIDGAIDSVFEALASALGFGGKEEEKPAEGEFDGQIGEEIAFSAGGEGHKLWVDASGQVIVASTPTPVEKRLDDWEKRASEPPSDVDGQGGPKEEDKGRATAAIRSAREKLGLVEKEVGEAKKATTSEGEEAGKADAEVEFAEKSLSSVLTTLFDIYQDKADAEVMADANTVLADGLAQVHPSARADVEAALASLPTPPATWAAAKAQLSRTSPVTKFYESPTNKGTTFGTGQGHPQAELAVEEAVKAWKGDPSLLPEKAKTDPGGYAGDYKATRLHVGAPLTALQAEIWDKSKEDPADKAMKAAFLATFEARSGGATADPNLQRAEVRSVLEYVAKLGAVLPPEVVKGLTQVGGAESWACVFATGGKKLTQATKAGDVDVTLRGLWGDPQHAESKMAEAIERTIKADSDLQTYLTETYARTGAHLDADIAKEAAAIIAAIMDEPLHFVKGTEIPRNVTEGQHMVVNRAANAPSRASALYDSIVAKSENPLLTELKGQVHHLVPLYLGGGHQESNLAVVEGHATTRRAPSPEDALAHADDTAHQVLHDLIDKTEIADLIDAKSESTPLDWASLASAFDASALSILVGTLAADGRITYQQTALTYQATPTAASAPS